MTELRWLSEVELQPAAVAGEAIWVTRHYGWLQQASNELMVANEDQVVSASITQRGNFSQSLGTHHRAKVHSQKHVEKKRIRLK